MAAAKGTVESTVSNDKGNSLGCYHYHFITNYVRPKLAERPLKKQALFCTATVGPDNEPPPMELPADGACDYMFFDSLYFGTSGKHKLLDDKPSGALEAFLKRAENGQKTEYAVGINIE